MNSMHNKDIAALLRRMAAAYLLQGGNRFKVIAYERAAETVEQSIADIGQLWKEKKLSELDGIGTTLAAYLDELFRTGKVKHFEGVLSKVPAAVFPLLDVPSIGPKRALALVEGLSLSHPATAVADVLNKAQQGQIAGLSGFGKKSEQDIIDAIGRYKKGQVKEQRMPLPYAAEIANDMVAYLRRHDRVEQAIPLGSLRRGVATIGDIDLGVATTDPPGVIEWFLDYPNKKQIIEKGPAGATILLANGRQIDLRVQEPKRFGAMLQYFTGNKNHNVRLRELALKKGLSLNEFGIKKIEKSPKVKVETEAVVTPCATEEDFYAAVGVPWMPPELREDRGEIDAAVHHRLPLLVSLSDIRGDFHVHTNYDLQPSHDLGSSSIEEIVHDAHALGYEYVGLSDHNPSVSTHTKSEIVAIMKKRKEYIDQIKYSKKSVRVHIFTMLEVDIQPDGSLALPEEAFPFVDAVIVSIHSNFHLDWEAMTGRVLQGLSHPKAKILGHPTGRLLGKREGFDLDWQKLFSYCSHHGKAIEINSSPLRLDLPDQLVKIAVESGVKLVINTDSHDASQLSLMRYGVQVAQRGWAEQKDILNTMPYPAVKEWLEA